ncbi:putative molybdenum cofactor guanylyltransferase MobA [Gottschalkia purinilytica]|uniref:Probable molybdenum cofactor guanylyltransferase n=1 Tax=Gottschalkia purinilytica TaxID=1503 RepID=A0A0L0W7I8_GOTPU|nr:molybdenum cofactor guanylyltransferase [Gottschalkia purinilytica]KNF07275.1 putative molybdenum cofactor guanylyltransferase MobA [Gottschalkia purinilytica]
MEKFKTAVILAGGKSSRMGFDKQFLRIKERRLMDIVINKLKEEFEEIVIVTNKPEYYVGLSDKITSDIIKGMGPLSGIHVGLKNASSRYSYFIACDMPNVNLEYIRYMKKKINELNPKACITRLGGWIEAFNGFYSKDLVEEIEEHLKEDKRSVNSLLKKVDTLYIEEEQARKFSPKWEMFINLNTREELDNYIKNYSN